VAFQSSTHIAFGCVVVLAISWSSFKVAGGRVPDPFALLVIVQFRLPSIHYYPPFAVLIFLEPRFAFNTHYLHTHLSNTAAVS